MGDAMHFRIFEFWRLSAALLIMAWHFLRFAPPGHEAVSAALYRLMPLMEMFFMISGFLIMLRYADTLIDEPGAWRRFIVRRIARFYPLYLVTLLFFAAIGLAVHLDIVHTDAPGRYDFATLPANILLMQAWGLTEELTFNYVSWSMSAEWFCYLALPLIVLAWRKGGKTALAVVAALSIAALEMAVAYGIIPFPSWLEANTWGAYRAFADFALGALVAMAARDTRSTMTSHAPAWVVFALAIAAMATKEQSYLVVALLGLAMYFAAVAERNNPAGSRALTFFSPVGKVSLGIYLIHPVIEAVFFSILWNKVIEPTGLIGFYVYWIMPMAVVIAVAILSDRYFEGPAARLINRLAGTASGRRDAGYAAPAE
jgi:peptidoglycan/LPS O-acetylase OafA/YrhL